VVKVEVEVVEGDLRIEETTDEVEEGREGGVQGSRETGDCEHESAEVATGE